MAAEFEGFLAILGLPHYFQVRLLADHLLKPATGEGVAVG
jgi:hypothetical protein